MLGKIVEVGLVFIPALWCLRWLRRIAFLKDYAFAVSEAFGPTQHLPARERVRRRIPWLRAEDVDTWLGEFTTVTEEVWQIARRGCPQRLGTKLVRSLLRARFPFLRYEGLRSATFLAGYYAMKEGFDISPEA